MPLRTFTTPYYVNAGRGAVAKVPRLWLCADNDHFYEKALALRILSSVQAACSRARFELLHDIPGDGHLLRLYPDRWRPITERFLASPNRQRP